MTSYLLDADWVINALANKGPVASVLRDLAADPVYVCWTTAAELYEGAFHTDKPSSHLSKLRQFLEPYPGVALNDAIAERFASIRASLRARGELISDFDIILAATAFRYGLTLLTFNVRHLERIAGLKLFRAHPGAT